MAALTLEEIGLRRMRDQEVAQPPEVVEQQRIQALHQQILDANAAYTPPAPEPSALGQALEFGGQLATDVGKTAVGVGETALQAGTGLAASTAGVAGFAGGAALRLLQNTLPFNITPETVSGLQPDDPNYWRNLVQNVQEFAARHTYEPQTEAGRQISTAVNAPLAILHEVSQRASEAPLARLLLTDDQRHALAYAHEIVLMAAAGEIGGAALRSLRGKIGTFRERLGAETGGGAPSEGGTPPLQLPVGPERLALPPGGRLPSEGGPPLVTPPPPIPGVRATAEGGSPFTPTAPSEGLLASAQDLITSAERIPEVQTALESAGGIPPRLLPELRTRGQGIVERLTADPTNTQTIQDAQYYLENTRGVSDTVVNSIKDTLQSAVPETPLGVPERVARLREAQQGSLGPVDNWLAGQERQRLLAETQPPQERVQPPLEEAATPALRTPPERGGASIEARVQALKEQFLSPDSPVSREVGRFEAGLPNELTTEQKIDFARAKSTIFSAPEMQQAILGSLERGNPEPPPEMLRQAPGALGTEYARMKYEEALHAARDGIHSSAERRIKAIMSDIMDLLSFDVDPNSLGMNLGSVMLSHKQKMAAQRLSQDAARAGRTLKDYMDEHTTLSPITKALIDNYAESMRVPLPPGGVGPKNMRLDQDSLPSGSDPVYRRTNNGRGVIPVWESEMATVQQAKPVQAPNVLLSMETPLRTAERFDPTGELKKLTVYPERAARSALNAEVRSLKSDLNDLRKQVGYREQQRVAQGTATTPEAGVLANALRQGVQGLITRVNDVRAAIGEEALPPPTDSLAFMRSINSAKAHGDFVNLVTMRKEDILAKARMHAGEAFPRTATQFVLRRSGEPSLLTQMETFSTDALKQIHYSPISAKLRELANNKQVDTSTPPLQLSLQGIQGQPPMTWDMARDNPGLHQWLNNYANVHIDGVPPTQFGKVGGINLDHLANGLMQNNAFALLSLNARSLMSQPSSLVNTWHTVGLKHLLVGVKDAMASAVHASDSAMQLVSESQVLSARKGDTPYREWAAGVKWDKFAQNVREGRLRDAMNDVASFTIAPIESADYQSAVITGLAAKSYGKSLGLTGKDLVHFVDDTIIKTQASGAAADRSPIQAHTPGKLLTQYGTFGISDINYYLNDVWGKGGRLTPTERATSIARMFGIMTAVGTVYEAIHQLGFGTANPLPLPGAIGAVKIATSDDKMGEAWKAVWNATQAVPILGSAR